MDGSASLRLTRLLGGPDAAVCAAAWDELIENHTGLLLAVARSFGGDYDGAMDRYSYILGKLREDDFRRLRSFQSDRGASFTTWLTLAARRLCLDHVRARYGRTRADRTSAESAATRALRRTLADSLGLERDIESISSSESLSADAVAVLDERNKKLRAALRALEPRERLLLALRFEDGRSASQIAQFLGVPTPFHVYRQLNALLAHLRRALQAEGIDASDG